MGCGEGELIYRFLKGSNSSLCWAENKKKQ